MALSFQAITRVTKGAITALILLLGLTAGLGHLLAYAVEHNQAFFADWLSRLVGVAIHVDRLSLEWRLLTPALRMENVVLGDPGTPLHLRRVDVDLRLKRAFSSAGPLRISLYGAKFHVVRERTGQVRILGLPDMGTRTTTEQLVRPMRLRLVDAAVTWEDRKKQHAPQAFESVFGTLERTSDGWRLAVLVHAGKGSLTVTSDLRGDPEGSRWSGYTKIQAQRLDLAKILGYYLPAYYRLPSAQLDGEAEFFWQEGRLVAGIGDVSAHHILLIGDRSLRVDRLSTKFHFDSDGERWRLALTDMIVEREGSSHSTTHLELESDTASRELAIAADALQLQDLTAVSLVRVPQPQLRNLLEGLQPSGEVRNFQLRLNRTTYAWQAAGRFQGVNVRPYDQLPGIDRVAGEFRADQGHVQVRLTARDTEMDFGHLFRRPIPVVNLGGQIDWRSLRNGAWQLRSDEWSVATPDVQTRTRLLVSGAPNQPLYLDLQSDLGAIDATRVSRYLPVGIMRAQLVDWLDRAFGGGTLTGGTLLLRGPVNDFPFDETHNGHFEALFGVHKLTLDYQRKWPPLDNLTAEVRFHNNALEIHADSARIYDSESNNLIASIPQLDPTSPIEIRGELEGPLDDELRLLTESPLAKHFGPMAEGLRAGGRVRLSLDMAIPVYKLGKYRLTGTLQLLGNSLELVHWQLPLKNINGELDFDLESIRASDITMTGLGSHLNLGVASRKAGTTVLTANGRIDVSAIRRRLPRIPLDRASGDSDFIIRLEIPGRRASVGERTWLDVQTALKGIRIDLPPPFGKGPGEARNLRIRVPVSGQQGTVHLRYADLVDAVFDRDGGRGQIQFGGAAARLPSSAGLEVRGHIRRFNVDPWIKTVRNMRAGPAYAIPTPPFDLEVAFDELLANGFRASDLQLRLRRLDGTWSGELDSPEIAGRFSIPASWPIGTVTADLNRLILTFEPTTENDATSPKDQDIADPRTWPGIDFRCDRLQLNKAKFDAMELLMTRSPDGLVSKRLRFAGDLASFDGRLDWQAGTSASHSTLVGKLTTTSLGKLLKRLGYTPQLVDTPGEIELDLNWSAPPMDIDERHLNGRVGFNLGAGRFLEFDPGVTRVFGLLNLSALQRRLRLDFSDLFKRGFSFDDITGHFTLEGGDAYTNDFQIDGPSGKIEIAGRTGIAAKDFDQLVSVTPRLDATLPIAGTIAGGPVGGVAAWVAQRLMRKQVDRINRFQYNVKGPWENPTIVPVDSGGTLSKLFGADQPSPGSTLVDHPDKSVREAPNHRLTPQTAPSDGGGGGPSIKHQDSPVEPNGSLLDRLLEQLEPNGSGRETLEATE